ncbi:hypothetical protein P8R33_05705 [Qipengyuania sp. XHP0211]|uniref:hypothetical protein n=1 Tax=Qipengyuania sp. XHP0211 TaxID=3038079 RepID=UPI0024204339|nr:hypothetical protein [Qipengyuania sp. XHP0211]MDG5750589.1 hypothetical protein [Qipengyuania sp. XHP0211]
MDPNLLLIFGFILVVLSIIFPFAYVMNKREHDHKERKLELQARAEEAKAQQARFQNGDYSRMEERVRVLERIATDSNHALASQIDELRTLDRIEKNTGEAAQ